MKMLRINLHNTKRIVILLAVALLVAAMILYLALLLTQKSFYRGVSVEGMDLSGMVPNQAKIYVSENLKGKYAKASIVLTYGENRWQFGSDEIGLKYLGDVAIDNAYRVGRSGNFINRLREILLLRAEAVNFIADTYFDRERLENRLSQIKAQIDKEAVNALVSYNNSHISISKEVIGRVLPVDKNVQLVENHIKDRDFNPIALMVEDKVPNVVYNDIKEIGSVLSSFSTTFALTDSNRVHNIKLGSDRIDGTILFPNDIFSMNEVLGPRTTANGYMEAPVIFRNELVPGTGGGVCQISSTLYNTVLLSKIDVLQRTHHSWPLGYVEPGRDATIAENYIDFKFQNSLNYPISINAEVTGNKLTIRMLGKARENEEKVKLRPEILEVTEPEPEELVIDESVPEYEKVTVKEARKGMRVILYRETYNPQGELINTEKISEDVYKPVRGESKVNQRYYSILQGSL